MTATITNCAKGTLTPFVPSAASPWNRQKVQHLLKRMGFGASPEDVDAGVLLTPSKLVDNLVDEALKLPLFAAPTWANWPLSNYKDIQKEVQDQYIEWATTCVKGMIDYGFREKLVLFWHNHFVTRAESYFCPSYLYQYHKLLQQNVLGNFKAFVKNVGTTPAMLVYLNGVENNRYKPNENYARELYELFTLGRDNGYTQNDIKETARALTGWVGFTVPCAPIGFSADFYDPGSKTIFGKTGAYGYNELHDLLFTERKEQIASYICTKIYKHFVNPDPDQVIIAGMAKTFINNNFELAPVFRELFKSEHFFDAYIIGVSIKSPYDFVIGFLRDVDFPLTDKESLLGVFYLCGQLGQEFFQPVDVAGWPGNRSWITNTYLTGRWQTIDYLLYGIYQKQPNLFRTLAKYLSKNSNQPDVVTKSITDFFLPNPLRNASDYKMATEVFKSPVPANYFDNNQWTLDWDSAPAQVALLLQYLGRLPEFQLA